MFKYDLYFLIFISQNHILRCSVLESVTKTLVFLKKKKTNNGKHLEDFRMVLKCVYHKLMFTFWRKYKCFVCTRWLVIYVFWIMPVNSFSLWGLKWIKIFEKSNGCWYSVIAKEFSADKAILFTCWTNKNKIMAIFIHTHKNNPGLKTKVCKWDYFLHLPLSNVINIMWVLLLSVFCCIHLHLIHLIIFQCF